MIRVRTFLVACLTANAVLYGCTKETTTSGVNIPENKYTPTCAYYSQENIAGSWEDFVYFFDLSDTPSSKKMYFVAKPIYANKDTLEVVVMPGSMDNLGPGFPAEITDHPGFGWVKQWTNPEYRLKFNGQFYKEPITAGSAYSFLSQSSFLGSMANKWPQAEIKFYLQEPLGNGTLLRHYAYFYFNENQSYHSSSLVTNSGISVYEPYSIRSINAILPGFSGYDWPNVSAYFALYKSYYDRQTHYFLDFKNWRYFTVEEGATSVGVSGTQPTLTYNAYKSLDNLVKWPADWGKQ